MLIVASLGLVVNLISMRILAGGRDDSLNVKGAYLEVWADMLGSIGVIGAAIAIYVTKLNWIDPIVAIGIGLWVLPRTCIMLRDTTHILLQGVPRGFDLSVIRGDIECVEGVASVHDLHLWSVAGDDASLTAHVALDVGSNAEEIRQTLATMLEDRFGIHHATIQTETIHCKDNGGLHR